MECELTASLGDDGLILDYGILKKLLRALCDETDEQVILSEKSPYLDIIQDGKHVIALFNDEHIPFLPRDVTTLPIANTTVEELSHYFFSLVLNHHLHTTS